MKTVIAVVFTIALAAPFSNARACTCGPNPTPLEELANSDAVFSGTVVLINLAPDPEYLDVFFIVSTYWKGSVSVFQKVTTASTDGACGFSFFQNSQYLVYAWQSAPGELGAGLCTRTTDLSSAQQDLDALGPGIPVPVEKISWGAVKSHYTE